MSYCRWSSDGFMCDLYIYADSDGGYTIHVASSKLKERAPEYWWKGISTEEFQAAHELYREHMDTVERETIGLAYDGRTFNFPTSDEAADFVETLIETGYNVPDYVVPSLREETDDEV